MPAPAAKLQAEGESRLQRRAVVASEMPNSFACMSAQCIMRHQLFRATCWPKRQIEAARHIDRGQFPMLAREIF